MKFYKLDLHENAVQVWLHLNIIKLVPEQTHETNFVFIFETKHIVY